MTLDYEKLGAFYLGKVFDPAAGATAEEPLLYDSRDLCTHAVCVGMTGSGKTGLCLALLEEAAIDGIPAICIDPKGDLGNLLLTFPELAPHDFARWVDAGEAARRNLSVEQYGAKVAEQWRAGLAEWHQSPERIARFRAAVDVAIYTPGSDSGLPLSILQSLAPPPPETRDQPEALGERISSVVSGLLQLLGREADPLRSREHILLSNILAGSFRAGEGVELAALVAKVQKPGFDKLGALDLETFYPAKERMELALALNGLLASPRYGAWTRGEPLDAQRLLFTAEGKPRIAIISIAHLADAERMFVVTLLLNEVIGWMRRQSGTTSLRAILYMDEIFGYFPPTANPPSKPPMLTLLKQARAYGLGVVLATQNPVDLDYKGLGNTGTWLIGRLQTERDRDRVLDGLGAALAGSGPTREELARLMGALTQRVFLMRNVHDDSPVLLKSRWALSYLRGPLTPAEIARLMAPHKNANGTAASKSTSTDAHDASGLSARSGAAARPVLAGIEEAFVPVRGTQANVVYRPRVGATVKLHYVERPLDLDAWQALQLGAPLDEEGTVAWAEATVFPEAGATPVPGAEFAPLPAAALRSASYAAWGKALAAHVYQQHRLTLLTCDAPKLVSLPGESEGDFRARLQLAAREHRDAEAAALRERYAPRLASLQARRQSALQRAEVQRDQASQQKMQTAISVGATILGAFLGRKRVSATSVGRATTAARSATRIGRETADVARAEETVQSLDQQLADLSRELEQSVAALGASFDAQRIALRELQVAPRKSDILVEKVRLLWVPVRRGADGFPEEAW